ncbi:MAG: RecX family transcriptional regulator [Cytophagaceae bacterium]|nr:RecX family transcriptional regulator [Gemmatimonadaceae bacterium]
MTDTGGRGHAPRPRKRQVLERLTFAAGAVTGLRALDTSGARFLLSVGEVDGRVSAEMIGDFKLSVGRLLSELEAADLTVATHRLQVFDQGVSLLSIKARSVRELTLALRRRGATEPEAKDATARMVELRLLDDAAYAKAVAQSKVASGRMSKRRVQQELARRGVAPELVRSAIGEVVEEAGGLDEHDAALALAQKRMRSLGGLDAPTAKRRLYAFLARRGYDGGVVKKVVSEVVRGVAADD